MIIITIIIVLIIIIIIIINISNDNRTEKSRIRSVIIRVMIDDCLITSMITD